MIDPTPRWSSRPGLSWSRIGGLSVATIAAAVVLLLIATGSTKARLTAAEPADGATLAVAPTRVMLEFSGGPLDPANIHVGVATNLGLAVTSGPPEAVGSTVVVPVRIVYRGTYLVGYHVALGNGRELSGLTSFTVSAGGDPAPNRPDSAVANPVAVAAQPPAATAGGGHDHDGVDPLSLAVLGANAVLVVLVALAWLRRRRRT